MLFTQPFEGCNVYRVLMYSSRTKTFCCVKRLISNKITNVLTSIQELMLFPILTSTSNVSLTFKLEGRWNSTWSGLKHNCYITFCSFIVFLSHHLKTRTVTGAENLRPEDDTVKAQRDHFPASWGAEVVIPEVAISDLERDKLIAKFCWR